ncbi:MAG: GGDEF domain-containing protein [Magnetococcales bacterium]|nr:GGDEF domain-containing protein [Magnetococcales bacterium]
MEKEPVKIADHLSTGIAEIDDAHQKLMSSLASLHKKCIHSVADELIHDELSAFRSLAMNHFQVEERFMEQLHYQKAAEHTEEHLNFPKEFAEFSQALFRETDAHRKASLVQEFLQEWMHRHTLTHDIPFGQFLRTQKRETSSGPLWLVDKIFIHHLEQIFGEFSTDPWSLIWPWRQPHTMVGPRARIIISRVRLLSGLFALLTPIWVLVDFLFFPAVLAWPLAMGRVMATLGFATIAVGFKSSESMQRAYGMSAMLFFVPMLFFLYTSWLFLESPPPLGGFASDLATGYAFLPFVMSAGISVFPLTALEGALLSLPGLLAELLTGHFNQVFQAQTGGYGILWLMSLIAGVAVLAAMSQLHFWSTIVIKASRDSLTRACNRAAGYELLERYFVMAKRHRTPLAILFFDIDNFKGINDQFGHEAGDEALRSFAAALHRLTRKEDVVIRWGGEEFLIVLPLLQDGNALELMHRICGPFALGTRPDSRPLTASVGMAELFADRPGTLSALIALADARMYRAKKSGKNRICFADGEDGMTPTGSFG